MSSILHLRHRPEGHARVSEIITVGRTGFWRVSRDRALSCERVALWEFHPDFGGIAPFVAIANITDAYYIKWVDMRRLVVEFDVRSVDCETILPSTVCPAFHRSGVVIEQEGDLVDIFEEVLR